MKLTLISDTNIPKPDLEGQDPAWTGAIVASRVHEGQEDEFLFAIVGSDPEEHNPLAANNSAIVFADEALMTPERKMRALQTFSRMANTLHNEQAIALPPDQLVPTVTRELVEQSTLFGKQIEAQAYGGHNV